MRRTNMKRLSFYPIAAVLIAFIFTACDENGQTTLLQPSAIPDHAPLVATAGLPAVLPAPTDTTLTDLTPTRAIGDPQPVRPAALPAPNDLVASVKGQRVVMTWTAVPDAIAYEYTWSDLGITPPASWRALYASSELKKTYYRSEPNENTRTFHVRTVGNTNPVRGEATSLDVTVPGRIPTPIGDPDCYPPGGLSDDPPRGLSGRSSSPALSVVANYDVRENESSFTLSSGPGVTGHVLAKYCYKVSPKWNLWASKTPGESLIVETNPPKPGRTQLITVRGLLTSGAVTRQVTADITGARP
jgi:hypothetical protein